MPQYFTPKLGLTVHGMEDGLNAGEANWKRLDQTFSGVIWVPPDVIPDNTVLFDGALIAETSGGKVWRAQKNIDGSFAQKWIKYPWMMVASFVQTNFIAEVANHPWGYTTVESQSYGASADDLVGGRVKIPVTGIYAGKITGSWSQSTGSRSQKISITTGVDEDSEILEKSWPSWPAPVNYYTFNRKFNAGDLVCGSYWQNGAGTGVTLVGRIDIVCVRPV